VAICKIGVMDCLQQSKMNVLELGKIDKTPINLSKESKAVFVANKAQLKNYSVQYFKMSYFKRWERFLSC
jgi:hypothetical protein